MRSHRSVHNSSSEYTVTPRFGIYPSIYLSTRVYTCVFIPRERDGGSPRTTPPLPSHSIGAERKKWGWGWGTEVHCVVCTVAGTMKKQWGETDWMIEWDRKILEVIIHSRHWTYSRDDSLRSSIITKVCSSKLSAPALHHILLLKVFKLSHYESQASFHPESPIDREKNVARLLPRWRGGSWRVLRSAFEEF